MDGFAAVHGPGFHGNVRERFAKVFSFSFGWSLGYIAACFAFWFMAGDVKLFRTKAGRQEGRKQERTLLSLPTTGWHSCSRTFTESRQDDNLAERISASHMATTPSSVATWCATLFFSGPVSESTMSFAASASMPVPKLLYIVVMGGGVLEAFDHVSSQSVLLPCVCSWHAHHTIIYVSLTTLFLEQLPLSHLHSHSLQSFVCHRTF